MLSESKFKEVLRMVENGTPFWPHIRGNNLSNVQSEKLRIALYEANVENLKRLAFNLQEDIQMIKMYTRCESVDIGLKYDKESKRLKPYYKQDKNSDPTEGQI